MPIVAPVPAYTAGKTLFRWFHEATGVNEAAFRAHVYMAAVARCFPGKAPGGGGDRVPDATEIQQCASHLRQELTLLQPKLILAVGKLAIAQVLGTHRFGAQQRLAEVVGGTFEVSYLGHPSEVICLPHPSGLSAWPKTEPGKTLLAQALRRIAAHPQWQLVFRSS